MSRRDQGGDDAAASSGKPEPITPSALRRATSEVFYQRGEDYFRGGQVYALLADGDRIVAKVHGTRNYKVRLWAEDGEAVGECSCPVGERDEFCKHMVAVGLAHLAGGVTGGAGTGKRKHVGRAKRPAKPQVTLDDVREYLLTQNTASLVEILMRQVMEDDRLCESLLMKVARQRPGGLDVATFQVAIDAAADVDGFVDYGDAYDFTAGVENVVDSLAELLEAGHAAEVIELTEHALRRVERALSHMDDSDGDMSSVAKRLEELHHAACLKARPDPKTLARRLFEWEMQGPWDTFHRAAETYADVLGDEGLAVYRRLAQRMWKEIPELGPGDRGGYGDRRFRITSIMEALAETSGDIEQLVAIKARDLSFPYHYLQIAEVYQHAGLADKALAWAEKGVKAFDGKRSDSRLEDFLADAYHRRRRHDEAMALIWRQFAGGMDLDSYQHLKAHADRAKQWPVWREKALSAIRAALSERKPKAAARPRDPWRRREAGDHSILVEIFLWEGDVEAAWRQAQAGGCHDDLWMRLAEKREKDHPADALAVYQRQIDPIVEGKNNESYRAAAKLLGKIRRLMGRLGQREAFAPYLESVRKTHKPKRNFMAMVKDL